MGKPTEPDGGHHVAFVETEYIDDALLPALNPEQKAKGYIPFQRHWMDLVFPSSIPQEEEVTDRLHLMASREEFEPVNLYRELLKSSEIVYD